MQPSDHAEDTAVLGREYLAAGYVLVPIPLGRKGPTTAGWNLREQCVTSASELDRLTANIGLAHSYSRTCVVDVDDALQAETYLHEHGRIELAALLAADDAVQIRSGRPGRAKLLYRLPAGVEPLPTVQPPGSGLELRCGTRDGSTVQDLLPPSIHPDTRKPYTWGGAGDWSDPPPLPAAVHALWGRLLGDDAPRGASSPDRGITVDPRTVDELRSALRAIPADDYHTWVRIGCALSGLGEIGRELWLAWSQTSPRWRPRDAAKWETFGGDRTSHEAVFAEAQRRGWQNPRAGVSPPEPPAWVDDAFPVVAPAGRTTPTAEPGPPPPLFDPAAARVGHWLDTEPPPRRYLLVDRLALSIVGLLVGSGGTGKSMGVVQILLSVATGLPVWGAWSVAEAGSVLYLAAEESAEELHRRVYAAYRAAIADPDVGDIRGALADRLYVHSLQGRQCLITAGTYRDVVRTAYVERIIATARQIPDLRLIVLDPVSRFRGGDENDSQAATMFIAALESIAQATGATVLGVHHTTKASQGANGDAMAQGAARGASALTDGCRWQLNLATMTPQEARRHGIADEDRQGYVRAEITKTNYAPPSPGLWLRRGAGGVLAAVDLGPDDSGPTDEELLPRIVALVRDRAARGMEYSRRACEEQLGGVDGTLGIPQRRLRDLIELALTRGALVLRPPATPTRNVREVLAVPGERQREIPL